jgi:sigma-B regulation protein RsbU (phosphoserine phosphatase)
MMDDHRLGFAVGDASSKGVSAATYVTVVRTLVKALALTGMAPAESLTFLNRLLYPESLRAMSVTLFYGILDLASGALEYSNAGHLPPYLLGPSAPTQFLNGPQGAAICSAPDYKYESAQTTLEPGTMLVLFTDGVVETGDEMGIPFSQERLTATLEKRTESSSPVSVIRDVVREMEEYSTAPQIDDSTLLAVKWQGLRSSGA